MFSGFLLQFFALDDTVGGGPGWIFYRIFYKIVYSSRSIYGIFYRIFDWIFVEHRRKSVSSTPSPPFAKYAQTLILVSLILVKKFSFLVITRSQELGFGRNLVEIDPRSLPDLFKQLRDQNNSQKPQKNRKQNFEKSY